MIHVYNLSICLFGFCVGRNPPNLFSRLRGLVSIESKWLVEHGGRWRLLLLRKGCPEFDLSLQASEYPWLRDEVLGLVEAWAPAGLPGWWITAGPEWQGCWTADHDFERGPLRSDGDMSLLDLALKASLGVGDA